MGEMNAVRTKLLLSVCSSVGTRKTQDLESLSRGSPGSLQTSSCKKQTLPKTENALHFPCVSVFFPTTPSYVPSIHIMGT